MQFSLLNVFAMSMTFVEVKADLVDVIDFQQEALKNLSYSGELLSVITFIGPETNIGVKHLVQSSCLLLRGTFNKKKFIWFFVRPFASIKGFMLPNN